MFSALVILSSWHRATRIEQWSLVNALGMIGATAGALALMRLSPLIIGIGSLVGLILLEQQQWSPTGNFGQANAVTTLRTGLLGLFPAFASVPAVIVSLSVLFLTADGLDGWLARRTQSASTFGAFFDKEADALFVLFLCTTAILEGRLPLWMIGVGLLRYVFVVLVFLIDPPDKTEPDSAWAPYVYGAMVTTLLAVFLPLPFHASLLTYSAAVALAISFGHSFWEITRRSGALH